MKRRALSSVVLVLVLGAAGMTSAAAADEFECGDVIEASIRLTNSLSACPNSGLIVGADDITIDLNGKSIAGNGLDNAGEDAGIDNSAGHTGVTITAPRDKPGKIRGFEQGVLVRGGTTLNTLTTFTATDNVDGVVLEASGNDVNRVKANGNNDNGIVVLGGDDNLIQDSKAVGNDNMGIVLTNTLDSADSNQVVNNIVKGNADEGIHLRNALLNTVRANNASGNGIPNEEDGIDLDGSNGNTIELNITKNNGEDGIDLNNSDNNTIRSNTVKNNVDDGVDVDVSDDNTLDSNNVTENRGDGFDQFDGDSNIYDGNTASENGGQGIEVHGAGNAINSNVAKRNGLRRDDDDELGIDASADPSVTGTANIAVGNDDPAQCDPSFLCE